MQRDFLKNQQGATAIEYGLICAVIVLVIIVGLTLLGNQSTQNFNYVNGQVDNAVNN
jgi:pilus assembly protein Flp/PilA